MPFTVEKAARDDGSMSPTPSSPNPEMYVLDSPYELDRWRPLAQWLLYVPHGLIVRALQSVSSVVFVIYWVIFLATGSLNRGLYGLMAMIERYGARSGAFLVGHSAVYPPFDFGMGPADNGAYAPVRLNLPDLPEMVSRKAALTCAVGDSSLHRCCHLCNWRRGRWDHWLVRCPVHRPLACRYAGLARAILQLLLPGVGLRDHGAHRVPPFWHRTGLSPCNDVCWSG